MNFLEFILRQSILALYAPLNLAFAGGGGGWGDDDDDDDDDGDDGDDGAGYTDETDPQPGGWY